jgi:carboxyl-terminal processing protease
MKRNYLLLASLLLMFALFSSCRKDIQNVETPESYIGGSFNEVFDAFWDGMNNNYVFWDIDTTNWDNMYKIYKPLFAKLDITKTDDVQKSVQYFRAMTDGLVDSHYNLSFGSPISDSSVSPSYDRKLKAGILRPNYVFYQYDANYYLDSPYVSGIDSVNLLDGSATEAIAGTIGGNILYLGFNQFNLKNSYTGADNGVKTVMQFFLNYLSNPPSGFKGVIIDVRGNGGGDISDLNFLVGNLINNKLTIGHTRYKSGNGRLDYTPWAPAIVTPQTGAKAVTVPVVVLTDIWTTSMAELTAMAVHALPNGNGHTVGETTWGATGPLTNNEILNGGQFTAANFLFAYTSSSMFKYIDGNIYEGKGFPPDDYVPFNLNDFQTYGDKQLEKALTLMP